MERATLQPFGLKRLLFPFKLGELLVKLEAPVKTDAVPAVQRVDALDPFPPPPPPPTKKSPSVPPLAGTLCLALSLARDEMLGREDKDGVGLCKLGPGDRVKLVE